MNQGDFVLIPEYFNTQSKIHGIGHTYRVMALTWELGSRLNLYRERNLAFIHDMARNHDGFCWIHGKRAAKDKLPLFSKLFLSNGASESDLKEIEFAVHHHCTIREPSKNHVFYTTLALLKDADALDRIRMGPYNLNVSMLRFQLSNLFIKPSEKLYFESIKLCSFDFSSLLFILRSNLNNLSS